MLDESTIKDCFQWDVRSWKTALTLWGNGLDGLSTASCLDVGSRDGGLSLYLALRGFHVKCTDLETPGGSAIELHKKYHVEHLVTYESLDALNIPYSSTFDVIIFKSILGGIGRNGHREKQIQALSEMMKALKPGGILLFAENLAASKLHRFMRKKFMKWGNYWNYPTEKSLQEMLAAQGKTEFRTTGFAAAFGRTEFQRNVFSVLDKVFFNHVVPSSWKYISFGYIVKSS